MDAQALQNSFIIIPLIIFELALKGFALWKSAKADHKYWFVAILLINTLGILPGIYLLFFQKDPVFKLDLFKKS